MQRFLLVENLRLFRARLDELPPDRRPLVEAMIAATERELAVMDADELGVRQPWGDPEDGAVAAARRDARAEFQEAHHGADLPAVLVDPRPGLLLVCVNLAYERATGLSAAAVVGKPLFVAFPDNPDDAVANGVANLYTSLRRVADKGIEDVMPPQRYDVRGGDGVWRQRWWLPVNRPIRDSAGRLLYLLHTVQAHEP